MPWAKAPDTRIVDGTEVALTKSEKDAINQERAASDSVRRLQEEFPSVSLTKFEKDALAAEGHDAVAIRSEAMIEKVKSLRVEHARKPVTYDGNSFDADRVAQQKLTGKLTYAQAAGKDTDSTWSVGWKTANNSYVQLSYTDLANVVQAVNEQVQAAYNNEAQLLAQIEQATTIGELDAIDLTTGWP